MEGWRLALEIAVWLGLAMPLYHHLGYPVVLATLAWLRPRPARTTSVTPPVTMIIAAYDEDRAIGAKLANSLELDYPNLQTIVANDGSTDRTATIVDSYARHGVLGLHHPVRRGKAAALNAAVASAGGDILVFSDVNAFYRADAIRHLVAAFGDPEVGCASGGKTLAAPDRPGTAGMGERLYWRYEAWLKRMESRVGSTSGVIGAMLAVRRSSFRPFPPGLVNEDAYLALLTMCRGERTVFVPQAVCWGTATAGMREDARRRVRMAAGRYQLFFGHALLPWRRPLDLFMTVSHKLLRLLIPAFMALAMLANLAVVLIPGTGTLMWLLLAGQLAFLALAAWGAIADTWVPVPRPARLVWYVAAGHLNSLRGLLRFLRGDALHLWDKAARRTLERDQGVSSRERGRD